MRQPIATCRWDLLLLVVVTFAAIRWDRALAACIILILNSKTRSVVSNFANAVLSIHHRLAVSEDFCLLNMCRSFHFSVLNLIVEGSVSLVCTITRLLISTRVCSLWRERSSGLSLLAYRLTTILEDLMEISCLPVHFLRILCYQWYLWLSSLSDSDIMDCSFKPVSVFSSFSLFPQDWTFTLINGHCQVPSHCSWLISY